MKKISFLALVFLNFTAFSQGIKKGDIILDSYYGSQDYLNLYYNNFVPSYRKTTEDELKYQTKKTIGPIGIRGEYLILNKIGVGFNICFNSNYTKNNNLQSEKYFYESKQNDFSFLPTLSYHFVQKEKFDVYCTFGYGLTYSHQKTTNTNPLLTSGKKDYGSYATTIGLGMRYFLTPHIGVSSNLQLGVGGLISAGVSYKI